MLQETREDERERLNRAYAQFDRRLAARAQANEMMMQSGVLVAKSLLILNGAAAIALLAFLAQVFNADLDSDRARLLNAILRSLAYFAWGAFAAVSCMAASFFANQATVNNYDAEVYSLHPPHVTDGPNVKRWERVYIAFMLFAISAAFISAALFGYGVMLITDAL